MGDKSSWYSYKLYAYKKTCINIYNGVAPYVYSYLD